MSLENMYNDAAAGTYVATVKKEVAVNFTDGTSRKPFLDAEGNRSVAPAEDDFQNGFVRNAPGSYILGGAQGITARGPKGLSNWTDKAFDLAFDGQGPAALPQGFYQTPDVFRRAGTKTVHMYTPAPENQFIVKNLSAKFRENASPSGVPPTF